MRQLGSLQGARAVLDQLVEADDMQSLPELKKRAVYWVARAKIEEDAKEYTAAAAVFDRGARVLNEEVRTAAPGAEKEMQMEVSPAPGLQKS